MKKLLCPWYALAGVLLLASCGNKDTFHTTAEGFTDILTANFRVADVMVENVETAPVDILWVIDNSGSMADYQNAVKNNMSTFMQRLSAVGDLDWRMGLLSTDIANTPFLGMGSAGTFDNLTPNPVNVFNAAVSRLGTSGSGNERVITPILNAVDRYPSFFRTDAMLAIFILTDAPAQPSESVSQFLSGIAKVKPDPKKVVTYGAFGAKDLNCTTIEGEWNYQGSKYQQMVSTNGGKHYPLCSPTFGADMATIAENILIRTQSAMLALPVPADSSSLDVTYQGTALPGNGSSNAVWRYNSSSHQVEIYDVSKLTDPQGQIQVTFLRAK